MNGLVDTPSSSAAESAVLGGVHIVLVLITMVRRHGKNGGGGFGAPTHADLEVHTGAEIVEGISS